MLTLKFYKYIPDTHAATNDSFIEIEHVLACQSYESYKRSNGRITITAHKGMTTELGVEFQIGGEEKDFSNCYVENSAGKTINKYAYQNPVGESRG